MYKRQALCALTVSLSIWDHVDTLWRESAYVSPAVALAQMNPLSGLTTLTSLQIHLSAVHDSIVWDTVLPALPDLDEAHCSTSPGASWYYREDEFE